jgi:small multidrug resistance pump
MSWVYLILAIITEVIGTTNMKLSQGFSKTIPSILVFVFYIISFAFLTLALKKLDISITYAIWSGVGTALITAIGFLYFKEPVTAIKIGSIALIVIGVVGLALVERHTSPAA